MLDRGYVLRHADLGHLYCACGCLQVFPTENEAERCRASFSMEPEKWASVQVEVAEIEPEAMQFRHGEEAAVAARAAKGR
jgi:hypothetical protein